MKIPAMKKLLQKHEIQTRSALGPPGFVTGNMKRLLAWSEGDVDGVGFRKWIDITDYTTEELLKWLGY